MMNIEKTVDLQLEAYNTRNLSAFLTYFDPAVEIFNFTERAPYVTGIEQLKQVYKDVFDNSPNLNVTIENRIILRNKVIDKEKIIGRKGVESIDAVVIYVVENELIKKMSILY